MKHCGYDDKSNGKNDKVLKFYGIPQKHHCANRLVFEILVGIEIWKETVKIKEDEGS